MTTTTQPTANDFLMGGGVPSAKFEKIGASVSGTICEPPTTGQQRDFTTQELKWWDEEKTQPMLHLVVTLQTAEIDDNIEDDDGRRRIYLKSHSKKAVADAVRKAGAKGLEVGGELTLTYTSNGESKKKGSQPPKLYSAEYVPPAAATLHDNRDEDEPPAKQMKYANYAEAAAACKSAKISEDDFKAALKKGGFSKWDSAASMWASGWIVNTIATRGLKKQSEPLNDDDIPF